MSRSFRGRVEKLEQYRKPPRQYVIRVSDPRTAEEEDAITNAAGPIVIVPHPCKTVEEWLEKCAPSGALQ